jgi:plastocyanin
MAKSNHVAKVFELASGTHAVVDPGILWATAGDTVEFHNDTAYQVKLLVAEGGLLDGVQSMQGKTINRGEVRGFTVLAAPSGVYEYIVVVKLRKGNHVFALGSSTPKIIIRSSSEGG